MTRKGLLRLIRHLPVAVLLALALFFLSAGGARAERLTLPAFTSRIEQEAFFGDTSLKEIVLNEKLKYIGPRAFADSGLKLIVFPSQKIDIAPDAFEGCKDLQAQVIPKSWAQQWCKEHGIPCVTIPAPAYSKGPLIVKNGASLQVELDSPHASNISYAWSSDNESVMTVDENGLIFGEYPGTATLSVSFSGGSGLIQIPVQVQANYRAALFSESTYYEGTIMRNQGDVRIMARLLNSVTGPDGGQYSIHTYNDLVSDQVFQKINEVLVKPSREGDVSLFFFASHGDPLSSGKETAGRLWCVGKKTWVALPDLAAALVRIKGKVIVILEACGPGAAMHDFDGTNIFLNSGDKFSILAAAGYMQYSKLYHEQSGDIKTSCNVFPYYIGEAVGTSGRMPADSNGDGILTLNELHVYVHNNAFNLTSFRNDQGLFIPGQNTCVWPENSDYPLFKR